MIPCFRGLLALCLVVVSGCAATMSYSPSSSAKYPPKAPNCPLDVLTVPPQRAFVQLGSFDFSFTHKGEGPRTAADLLEAVRARACQEGADAVIGTKSDLDYVQATAVRWTDALPSVPTAASLPATPSSTP
jgi:hypothetical protein